MLLYLALGLLAYLIIKGMKVEYIGVYPQPNILSYLKTCFIYSLIQIRKWRAAKETEKSSEASNTDDKTSAGYGVKSSQDVSKLEAVQDLGSESLAIDAVLFTGGSEDGRYMVISAARRQNNVLQCIFTIHIPGLGTLTHPNHPDTTLIQAGDETGWSAGGIELKPVLPMKKWSVKYNGDMKLELEDGSTRLCEVDLNGEYTSDLEYFDFDSDMEPLVVARAMARESWDSAYFQRIRGAHQNHYEQFGILKAQVFIDQVEYKLDLSVMRDHTHGSCRDWTLMHRYGLHNFTTRSGLKGFLGVISQPETFSHLELGYIYTPDKQKQPVQEVDLKLWRFGEAGTDPSDYGFRFKAGGVWYNVQVEVLKRVEVLFGEEWEARVIERFCRYKINGEIGWGVSEWEYRHREGKKAVEPVSNDNLITITEEETNAEDNEELTTEEETAEDDATLSNALRDDATLEENEDNSENERKSMGSMNCTGDTFTFLSSSSSS